MSDERPHAPSVVIVVDDDPAVLETMVHTLRDDGYMVHAAGNGHDALAIAEKLEHPPDLVVSDVRMEPMGGPELVEALFSRRLADRFLFVSGYGPVPEYDDRYGPCLAKPFSPERLLLAVADLLR